MEITGAQLMQQQMQAMASQAANQPASGYAPVTGTSPSGRVSFSDLLAQAVDGVNHEMQASSTLKRGLVAGDRSITMAEVTLQSQKADVAFTSMTEVRNKLLEAYKSMINMPL